MYEIYIFPLFRDFFFNFCFRPQKYPRWVLVGEANTRQIECIECDYKLRKNVRNIELLTRDSFLIWIPNFITYIV